MKFYQFAIAMIALIVLRQVAGDVLMLLTGLAVLANFGSLAVSSFFAGWLAGAISELGPSYGQLKGLAALGVLASIGIGFMNGVNYLDLAVVFMLLLNTPLSYVCLLLGVHVAELGIDVPPRRQEGSPGSGREVSQGSIEDGYGIPREAEPGP